MWERKTTTYKVMTNTWLSSDRRKNLKQDLLMQPKNISISSVVTAKCQSKSLQWSSWNLILKLRVVCSSCWGYEKLSKRFDFASVTADSNIKRQKGDLQKYCSSWCVVLETWSLKDVNLLSVDVITNMRDEIPGFNIITDKTFSKYATTTIFIQPVLPPFPTIFFPCPKYFIFDV